MNKFVFVLALCLAVSAVASPASVKFEETYSSFVKETDVGQKSKHLDSLHKIAETYEVQNWADTNARLFNAHMMMAAALRNEACGDMIDCKMTGNKIAFMRIRAQYSEAVSIAERSVKLARAAGDNWKRDDFLRDLDNAKAELEKYSVMSLLQ